MMTIAEQLKEFRINDVKQAYVYFFNDKMKFDFLFKHYGTISLIFKFGFKEISVCLGSQRDK